MVNLPSGITQSRTIQSLSGEMVTVTTSFSELPQAEAVWVIESDELYAEQYRVISVTDNNDGTYTITGANHDPDKYARIDTGAVIDQRPISVIPLGNQSPPVNIAISSFSVIQQNISVETMRVSWDQAQNAIAYEAQWRRNDGNWVNVPRSSTASFDVSGIYAGRYLVRVRAINAAEISSGWGYSEEKTLTGKVGNPPKPVGFMATGINWGIRLNWGFPGNTGDTLKTEIQYTANSDFSDPLLLSDVPYPSAEYTQLGLKAGQEFWYRAQLVDRTGNESGYNYIFQKQPNCDITLKHDIKYDDGYQSYENIKKFLPATYVYNDDPRERVRRGVIAQDVMKIDSEYVKLVPAAPKFDSEGNRVDADDTLALDNNVIMLDTVLALNYIIKQLEATQKELQKLKAES